MRHLYVAAMMTTALYAQDTATFFGEFKTYHINTLKQQHGQETSDTQGLSSGGQMGVKTPTWHALSAKAVMMTAQSLYVPDNQAHVDASLSNYDKATQFGDPKGQTLSVLGEAYVAYQRGGYDLKIGRQKLTTPWLEHRTVARLLPSTFSGVTTSYKTDTFQAELAYYDGFKQRTSDRFSNPLSHALGANTRVYTSREASGIAMASVAATLGDAIKAEFYAYHMEDFVTTLYAHANYDKEALVFDVQAIRQNSNGGFDARLKSGEAGLGSFENGASVTMVGAQASYRYTKHKTILGMTHFFKDANAFDDYIAPFDGGALYTDMLTSNNLFQSIYGDALKVAAPYSGGTLGAKVTQIYHITPTITSIVALARFSNESTTVAQTDFNAVLSYKTQGWTLDAKGIWCYDLNHVAGLNLQQYRLIATHVF